MPSVSASVLLRVNGRFAPRTSESEQCDALYASFVIGMDLCERAIEEARYLQALTLLRQEMETLAQLQAVQAARNKSSSPSVCGLVKLLYGNLSDAAHVRVPAMLRDATRWPGSLDGAPGPATATRYFPMFDHFAVPSLKGPH